MKLLMIGMDGVNSQTFDRGWTPFLKSLIDNGHTLKLKEDLLSRGWSEIVTGEHAMATGALYEGPLSDGTLSWTDKFKLSDVPEFGTKIKPLWQELNERGYRVGIMNVPTTYPAPVVNGFFVSGGGGGGPIAQDAVPEQCHPGFLASWLQDMGYIVDERMPSLLAEKGLYAPTDFFDRLDVMNQKRTQAFIELSNRYEIDFGFVVFKSSTVTTETLLPPELEKRATGHGAVNQEFVSAAEAFYRRLDAKIQALVDAYPNAEVVLVSDHSMTTRKYAVNANAFLVEAGFQTPSTSRRGLFDIVKSFKHLIPNSIKIRLKKNPKVKIAYQSMVTFDPQRTTAFSISFSNGAHGIYINDKQRFGGPVKESAIPGLSEEIATQFNRHPASLRHGLHAYPKPSANSEVAHKFPDVILDLPDGYQTSNRFPDFLTQTPLPSKPLDLKEMNKDPRTVGKGHTPLAVSVNRPWGAGGRPSSVDLTVIYRHILGQFPARENREQPESN